MNSHKISWPSKSKKEIDNLLMIFNQPITLFKCIEENSKEFKDSKKGLTLSFKILFQLSKDTEILWERYSKRFIQKWKRANYEPV